MTHGSEFSRRGFLGTALAGLAAPGIVTAAEGVDTTKPAPFRNPYVYKFNIGELEAFSISDANLQLGEGLGLMWPEEDRPQMKAELERLGEPLGKLPLYVNVLVIRSGKEVVVFDAGFGAVGNAQMGWMEAGLAAAGIAADQVTAGFLSHAHSDHIGGFVKDGKPMFPNAGVYLLPEELSFWRGENPDFSKSKRDKKPLPGMVKDVRSKYDILGSNLQTVKPGAEMLGGKVIVEAAPGHTDGHACFRIRSGNDELLHLMDLSHHHALMFANPEWTIAFDHNPEQAVVTRKKFWADAAAKRTRCYGFHLPWPGLGRIVPQGKGYEWWAERFMWT